MAGLATVARAWLTTEDLLRKTVGTDAAARCGAGCSGGRSWSAAGAG